MSDRLLVIGGTGMLGHRLAREAGPQVDTWWTARGSGTIAGGLLPMPRCIPGFDVTDASAVVRVLHDVAPTVVVNCAGAVKQRTDVSAAEMIRVNAVFPHDLADACDTIGARLVHLSTDCVFSGLPGARPHGYTVDDLPDATDAYGRSKLLGEVHRAPHLTVRTSMIGPELSQHHGLFDWFMAASPPVPGYTRALFSGLTTPALARVLLQLGFEHLELSGLHHLAGIPIDKHTLLIKLRDRFRPGVVVEAHDAVCIDRRLDGRVLAGRTGITPPTWDDMLDELAELVNDTARYP